MFAGLQYTYTGNNNIVQMLSRVNITSLLQGKIFEEFLTFNVFGKAVLYPALMIVLFIIILPILSVIYYRFSKRQVVD